MREICSVIIEELEEKKIKDSYFLIDFIEDQGKFILDVKLFNILKNIPIGTYEIEKEKIRETISNLKLGRKKKIFWFCPNTQRDKQMPHYYNWLKKTLEKGF